MGIAVGIEKLTGDCVLSYNIVLVLSIISVVVIITSYLWRINKTLSKTQKTVKQNFRLFSLLIYMFANTAAMIIILGANIACNGSSMSIMVVIFSGPIASIALIILGFLVDLRIKYITTE
jgi:hypothetical protein